MKKLAAAAALLLACLLFSCNSSPTGLGIDNSYNPNKPYAWVYDECGDSLRVNWKYNPNYPGDVTKLLFDSVEVPGIRIRQYIGTQGGRTDTALVSLRVAVVYYAPEHRWQLEDEPLYGDEDEDYYQITYPILCPGIEDPAITTQPQNVTVDDGEMAEFTVSATDGTNIQSDPYYDSLYSYYGSSYNTYTWYVNGVPHGATPGWIGDLPSGPVFKYKARYPQDNNAKVKVVVSNGFGKVTSRTVTLKVNATPPLFLNLRTAGKYDFFYYGYDYGYELFYEVDTLTAYGPGDADTAWVVAKIRGTGLSYQWYRNGVLLAGAGDSVLSLGYVRKSDSGVVVKCVAANARGKDSATVVVRVKMPSWGLLPTFSAAPVSTNYGSLLDFDTSTFYVSDYPGASVTASQERLDMVVAQVGGTGVYRLLTPKFARQLGVTSVSALDTARLSAAKMVVTAASAPLTQEGAKALFDQGSAVDSVGISATGSFRGNSSNRIIMKTRAGRYIVLEKPTASGSGTSLYFYFGSGSRKGSIYD